MNTKTIGASVALALLLAGGVYLFLQSQPQPFQPDPAVQTALNGITDDYRKIIVLVDGAETLDEAARARAMAAGRLLFYRKHQALDDLTSKLETEYQQAAAGGFRQSPNGIRQLIQYLTADHTLHDADKLAFQDLVDELDTPPPAPLRARRNPVLNPLRALRDNLQSIQLAYREEVTRIFSQFATRGGSGVREKWDAYVGDLRKGLGREQIIRELGDAVPDEPEPGGTRGAGGNEIFGNNFAPKTVALTFDDGPHPRYTEQVLALLRKYGLKACFFELGSHLGTVDPSGQVTLAYTAGLSQKVLEDGHVIADHSYSHPVLTKLSEADRAGEIDRTALLLAKIAGRKPELFRAPYGARNKQILDQVTAEGMRSVMWTIDSLDWADPVPESIVMRVLHQLNEQHKGIILFHDIHKQSVLALSPVIEELLRQDYTFLEYRGGQFVKTSTPMVTDRSTPDQSAPAATGVSDPGKRLYRQSWAVIVGINDYQNWPKLRYAVNDANSIEEALVTKFGFERNNIRKLLNGDATRQRIMEVLGDEFTDSRKVQREDRVFFFFAGHGATRTFEDGRQLGFIVPVDADRENYYSTAISMTSLREASDLIAAKHIYFVMDSCYSGLALSRGGGSFARDRSYLEEVTRRTARQILTAGGADQQVADDGPGGHSVFTWALLQGLDGQADLDGNGVITASELGAYVSPIVSQFARQTPTVGTLVGSEGGEFIFELKPQALSSSTEQLDAQSLKLSARLDTLEKEIGSKQAELLKLQQSIQSETAKLAQMGKAAEVGHAVSPASLVRSTTAPARPKSRSAQAYDLDRQGQQLYREKKYDEAVEKFKAAVDLKPNDPVLLNNLGFLYYVMGRYDDALAYLQKTLAIDPKRKEAHGNLAELYYKMGRKPEAKVEYEQYLALYPNSPKAAEFKKILAELQ
ncbi:MAG TPA: polysaccharide deacetylase family protein [Bryobacteraceae bacterium]|nr:polysaccharide deacetylase family protein [Bryobacteraceae bacterium]